jgi:hypothetical protein
VIPRPTPPTVQYPSSTVRNATSQNQDCSGKA